VSRARAVRKNKNSNFCSAGVCTSRLYFSVILSSSCFVLAARNTVQLKTNKQKKKKKEKKKKKKKKKRKKKKFSFYYLYTLAFAPARPFYFSLSFFLIYKTRKSESVLCGTSWR